MSKIKAAAIVTPKGTIIFQKYDGGVVAHIIEKGSFTPHELTTAGVQLYGSYIKNKRTLARYTKWMEN